MALFRFCHAQKNALTFFVGLTLREIAVRLRGLDLRLPVASCSTDRLLMIFLLGGHAALKRKEEQAALRKFASYVPGGARSVWERTLEACGVRHPVEHF